MADSTERNPRPPTTEPGAESPAGAATAAVTPASRIQGFAPAAHVILRIGAGLLFMQHGVQKLFGWLGGFGGTPGQTAELFSQMGLAGVLETFGGALIVIGLLTRPVAIILVLEMIAAYSIAHAPQGGFPVENGGELPLLYVLVFLKLAAIGAGPASVDHALSKRKTAYA